MGFENIFKSSDTNNNKKNKKNHPMENPEYVLDISNKQGISYNRYKNKKQKKILTKNKNFLEGFTESMTANQKNNDDFKTLKSLQGEFDSVLASLNSASTTLMDTTKKSLGLNNKNQFVVDMENASGQTYVGCYSDNGDRMLPLYAGVMTPAQCAQRASDLGKTVFGMQDSNGPTGQCFIGDDLDKAKSLGIGFIPQDIWSSDTNTIKQIALGYNGNLKGFSEVASDFNAGSQGIWGNQIWSSDSGQSDCTFEFGTINSVTASFALNCSDPKYNNEATIANSKDPGNITKWVAEAVEGKEQASVFLNPISWMGGDVARGCPKDFTSSYKCGGSSILYSEDVPGEANGKTAQYDCSDKACDLNPFRLVMQDDANLVIYTSKNVAIWASKTNGQQGEVTVQKDWIDSPNNLGSTIESGSMINVNQFLCSPSGKNIAMLNSDGNFIIYKSLSGCNLNGDNYFGSAWMNAVYSINKKDLSNLGKVGTVEDSSIRLFNSDLLAQPWGTQDPDGKVYTNIGGFNINAGDPIGTSTNTTVDKCKRVCTSNSECVLFTIKKDGSEAKFYGKDCKNTSSGNECYGEIIPTLQNRVLDSDWDLYIKNPAVKTNNSCSSKSNGISLTDFKSLNVGPNMEKNTLCGVSAAISEDLTAENNASDVAISKAKEILDQMDELTNQSAEFNKLQPKLRDKLFNELKSYKEIYSKISADENTSTTFDAQSKDSDLKVVADNFEFVLWSVIAIVSVIVTMKLVKKSN